MDVIPKSQLVDGQYYEGTCDYDRPCVARWNTTKNCFEYVGHRWDDTFVAQMVYWDDASEYFEGFHPLMATEPRDFENVEKV